MKYIDEVHRSDICPSCHKNLEADDIYEHFLGLGKTPEEALETAKLFGWTPDTPKKFGRVIGIETPQYDGVTWWLCPDCRVAWKRFEWSDPTFVKDMKVPRGLEQ